MPCNDFSRFRKLCRRLKFCISRNDFGAFFILGSVSLIFIEMFINIGMNLGILPVIGISLPFLSYGGSHLLTEFAGLGILMGMRRYRRAVHKESMKNEFLGV